MSTIRFTGAASTWLECLPLGDGRIGAMTDGGVATTTLHLNEDTAWSGSPLSESADGLPDAGECAALLAAARAAVAADDPTAAEAPLQAMQTRYAQSFVPLGDVVIHAENVEPHGVLTRELDLVTGVHRARTAATATSDFIARDPSVLVHVIEPASAVRVELRSALRGAASDDPELTSTGNTSVLTLRLPSDVAPGHEPDLAGATWNDDPSAALRAAIGVRVIQETSRTVVLVTSATTYAGFRETPASSPDSASAEVLSRLDAAETAGADRLRADAEQTMGSLLGSVSLSFRGGRAEDETDTTVRFAAARADGRGILAADPQLAAVLFDYGRYLLVSSSRPGGLPANLQGLWNVELRPPWGSGYTLNINTQMNYWGAHVTGLSSQAEALTDFTIALAGAAQPHTRRLYDAPGWTVHHNSDAWLYATAAGRGKGDPKWAFWPMGGAWLASLLTEAWEFGAAAPERLQHVWPTLRGAAEFALTWHHDGVTSPATSPENAFLTPEGSAASIAATTTMDLALIRMLFGKLCWAARRLGHAEDPVVVAAAARLQELPAMPGITPDGTIIEWDEPRAEDDPQHRHLSPLIGLYPAGERWDETRRAAAAATLARRGDDSSGWSLVWKLALWARLGRADKVADLLALFLRDADDVSGPWAGGLYPNLFAAHPPFQIDANLGFVGAVAECLLQSHDGVHLLPAVPEPLSSGDVRGLVARPGLLVDISWHESRLVSATLRARHPAAAGSHHVRWNGRSITVHIDTEHDTLLDSRSFFPEEIHP